MDYKFSVFPGRFQVFHNAHLNLALHALNISEKLIFAIGSVKRAPTIQNPLTYEERVEMIKKCFGPNQLARIIFIPLRDYYYNDHRWLGGVQAKTGEYIEYGNSVALVGAYKDDKSSWLNAFPQWKFKPGKLEHDLNASDIRKKIFCNETGWEEEVPACVAVWLYENFIGNEKHSYLVEEYANYKKGWDSWASAPYPPTFETVDTVVVKSGHILLVKRKFAPGKGTWALPGGFVNGNETRVMAAIRELREETGIRVPVEILERNIVMKEDFDFPYRSLRGRTFTMAYKIDLGVGPLPEVKGGDDAAKAFWVPFNDIMENSDKFFEDHADIIEMMMTSGKKEKFLL